MHSALLDPDQVTAAQSGDREALEALLAGHLSLVYNIVGRALGGHPDVDDVVQETMLRAVTSLPQLREPERFRSWLISIAIRQTQERGRSRSAALARQQTFEEAPELPDPAADPAGETIVKVHLTAQRREVAAATQWLTPSDQQLLALWWQEVAGTLTRADLAESLGISQGHAAVRIQRMKNQLDLARDLVRAWRAKPRCADLTLIAESGRTASLKRLGRHIRDCQDCRAADSPLVPADRLLTAPALLPVPVLLAAKVSAMLAAPPAAMSAAGSAGLVAAVDAAARVSVKSKTLILSGVGAAGAAATLVLAVQYTPLPGGGDDVDPGGVTAVVAGPTAPGGRTSVTPSAESAPKLGKKQSAGTPGAAPEPPTGVAGGDLFVAPKGSDTAPGTIDRPLASLGKAVERVRPGQTIVLRGGIYRPSAPVTITTSGTAAKRITLSGYRDEVPVFDASLLRSNQWFVTQRASYWTIQNLSVFKSPTFPWVCVGCQNTIFQRLDMHDNGATGLVLRGAGTSGNRVLDSDFHDNHDDAKSGADADGVAFKDGSGSNNAIRGVRAFRNADDGVDLSGFASPVTINRSWAYGNGHNRWNLPAFAGAGTGFKLGGGDPTPAVPHLVTDSAAWDNRTFGFTEQNNKARIRLTRNTAYRNGSDGFAFWYSVASLKGNLALANGRDDNRGTTTTESANSWNQPGWSTALLRGTDPATAEAPRPPAGTLPRTDFLTTTRDGVGAPMNP